MQIQFLYGTETGSAEILCDDLKAALQGEFASDVQSMEEVDPAALDEAPLYVFAVSTFGSGDLPFTAQAFCDKLDKDQPDLSHVRFAMFGLGDRTFSATFNFGSEQVMEKLLERNARMVGERFTFDASSNEMPEDIAEPWLRETLAQLAAPAG